jgi:hypothetical protein
MIYVFCGSAPSQMRGVFEMKAFGQQIELTDDQARDASIGGSAICPEDEFDRLGFTAEELRKYGPFGTHPNAPAEWQEKRRAALVACHMFRERAAIEELRTVMAEDNNG